MLPYHIFLLIGSAFSHSMLSLAMIYSYGYSGYLNMVDLSGYNKISHAKVPHNIYKINAAPKYNQVVLQDTSGTNMVLSRGKNDMLILDTYKHSDKQRFGIKQVDNEAVKIINMGDCLTTNITGNFKFETCKTGLESQLFKFIFAKFNFINPKMKNDLATGAKRRKNNTSSNKGNNRSKNKSKQKNKGYGNKNDENSDPVDSEANNGYFDYSNSSSDEYMPSENSDMRDSTEDSDLDSKLHEFISPEDKDKIAADIIDNNADEGIDYLNSIKKPFNYNKIDEVVGNIIRNELTINDGLNITE